MRRVGLLRGKGCWCIGRLRYPSSLLSFAACRFVRLDCPQYPLLLYTCLLLAVSLLCYPILSRLLLQPDPPSAFPLSWPLLSWPPSLPRVSFGGLHRGEHFAPTECLVEWDCWAVQSRPQLVEPLTAEVQLQWYPPVRLRAGLTLEQSG